MPRRVQLTINVPKRADESFKINQNSFCTNQEEVELRANQYGLTISPSNREDTSPMNSPTESRGAYIKDLKELELGATIGHGQTSFVKKAVHIPTQTVLAVKSINIYERKKRHQMKKEITALYASESDHLISLYDAFYQHGFMYVCLEYMDCGSLADVLQKVQRIPENILKRITYDILMGLHYLHKDRRLIHRDLKPANVCLHSSGTTKLTDFGISGELRNSLTQLRTVCGTFTYMSPERIRGESYSFKSDVWGLGLLLLECSSGKYPFTAAETANYIELIQQICHGDMPSAPEDFSPEFHDFISLCLTRDQNGRPDPEDLLLHPWMQDALDHDLAPWIMENNLVLTV